MIHCRLLLLLAAICVLVPATAFAREAKEQARIDYLIEGVQNAKGATFIRNGKAHGGADAAKHLRRKLDHAGDRIQTAEQFIKHAASESSLTRQKYKVRLADGTTLDAAVYFVQQLRVFDARKR